MIGQCDIIFIAVKPYQALQVMQEIFDVFKNSQSSSLKSLRPLIISMAASVPLTELEKKVLFGTITWTH